MDVCCCCGTDCRSSTTLREAFVLTASGGTSVRPERVSAQRKLSATGSLRLLTALPTMRTRSPALTTTHAPPFVLSGTGVLQGSAVGNSRSTDTRGGGGRWGAGGAGSTVSSTDADAVR
jgi:hypothetical protein